MPARSPGLSSTGPEVILKPTPSSLAMMLESVVLPRPGGPCSSTWSSASPRRRAALTKMRRLSTTLSCPLKSSKRRGRSAFSKSRSRDVSCWLRMSKSSCSMILFSEGTKIVHSARSRFKKAWQNMIQCGFRYLNQRVISCCRPGRGARGGCPRGRRCGFHLLLHNI